MPELGGSRSLMAIERVLPFAVCCFSVVYQPAHKIDPQQDGEANY
jgi:hypothetical protein